jgi:hypothetical protein
LGVLRTFDVAMILGRVNHHHGLTAIGADPDDAK